MKNKVLSWTGVGRTIEAMAGESLSPDDIQEMSVIFEALMSGSITSDQFIQAIHQAALDAKVNPSCHPVKGGSQ